MISISVQVAQRDRFCCFKLKDHVWLILIFRRKRQVPPLWTPISITILGILAFSTQKFRVSLQYVFIELLIALV